MSARRITRREAMKTAGALVGAGVLTGISGTLPTLAPRAAAQASTPSGKTLRIGFQVHRTGIGAVYGAWYEKTANAAVQYMNETGGIAGRPVELVAEDDIPYLVVSEGYHVPSGKMNRYVFQPGITDVHAQVTALVPWIVKNLGKKITMVFPDYAFGYDHRDFGGTTIAKVGGKVAALVPIPPTETSFTKYFPQIPRDTDVVYHVMVGPGVLTFVLQMGEYFGARKPKLFGFIDSLEGVDMASPGLDFLEGSHIWEALPRYADGYPTRYETFYRARVGVNASGASQQDPKNVSTYSHMFGVWETLFVIKDVVEQSGYEKPGPEDYRAFIETLERFEWFNEGNRHPQGAKKFVGRLHQAFGQQFISQVQNRRLKVVDRTRIEDGMYKPEGDYTKQPL